MNSIRNITLRRRGVLVWIVPWLIAGVCAALLIWLEPQTSEVNLANDHGPWAGLHEFEQSATHEVFRWTKNQVRLYLPLASTGVHQVVLRLQSGREETEPLAIQGETAHQAFSLDVAQQPRMYRLLVEYPLSSSAPVLTLTVPTFEPENDPRSVGVVFYEVRAATLVPHIEWRWVTSGVLLAQLVAIQLIAWRMEPRPLWRMLLVSLWLLFQLPWLLIWGYQSWFWQGLAFSVAIFFVLLDLGYRIAQHQVVASAPRLIFTICLTVYIGLTLFLPYPGGMTMTNGDEPHYLLLTHSLVHDGDFDPVNNYAAEDWRRFYDNDLHDRHLIRWGDRQVPYHSRLGLPLFLTPGYALGERIGALLLLNVSMALSMVLLYRASQVFIVPQVAVWGILLIGITYPVVIYSQQIYPESVAFLVVSFALVQIVHPFPMDQRLRALSIGFALGCLPHLHYKMVLLSAGLYVVFLWQQRRNLFPMLLWSAAAALFMAGLMIGWLYMLFGEISPAIFRMQAGNRDFVGRPFFGLAGLWFDQGHGLFFFAPLYILALVGMWTGVQNRATRSIALLLIFAYCCYHIPMGVWRVWFSPNTPVPRHIMPAVTILVIFAGAGWYVLWQRRQWLQLFVLVIVHISITVLLLHNRHALYGKGRTVNSILHLEFQHYGDRISAWLPTYLQDNLISSYGMTIWNMLVLGVFWYLCVLLNRYFIAVVHTGYGAVKTCVKNRQQG